MPTLAELNAATQTDFTAAMEGVYEHSPWVPARAWSARPFATLAALKHAMVQVVRQASHDEQLALIRAHPELAGKAAVDGALTAESTHEQARAGLAHCTPEEFARINTLNADYGARFGWPFILAVRGPRGTGLSRAQILATLARRIDNPAEFEFAEALRQIHRIAELRLNDKFGFMPEQGHQVWDWCERLARHSEPPWAERGELTATYLTDVHRAAAAEIAATMRDCGFDQVEIDAVGNVVGIYHGTEDLTAGLAPSPGQGRVGEGPGHRPHGFPSGSRRLLTGSHYDTVRNAGKYDGRIGHFVPMACVRALHGHGRRLPFGLEVVAFAEEEGQRYKATFLGSGALVGGFDPAWLDQRDRDGIAMREAMKHAGLPADLPAIAALRRDPARYLGFVEVHIEQGPVLSSLDLPLGIVTSINASVRYVGEIIGMASHAGTTPMNARRDAACAAAELALYLERRAGVDGDSVGTVGLLEVPGGSINVVPGRCRFSLDLRAPSNDQRDRLRDDVLAELAALCARRGLRHTIEETMRESAAPSDPVWQGRWEQAVTALGLPLHRLPSGAGHDAMKLHTAFPQAMLFVRGENAGISHNPLESSTADDLDLACAAFTQLLDQLAAS
ncbi:2-oxo-4-hydroxy-4-carboxy-5-ureidoimidazoline decarboxylase [Thiomonas intermedia]|uniref:2-oxo-4-hydroxy-4-carboxy-5-ureidoimidazoline decarboxylase n=1 Tax=Thiomonas intermedia TaxID=926 RepID=UPI0009A542AB|nr:2-oxo-4-hydroxy-4-carboxy-5-ureidoimidazoline decarboxylase [Thiomonas intermedia]